MLSEKQASLLIKFGRQAIEHYLKSGEKISVDLEEKWLDKKRGVFVTLETYPEKELRGCIGYIEAIFPLREAIVEASVSAAFKDSRFPPLREDELHKVILEISVLSKPELIKGDPLKEIEPQRHGVILKQGIYSGVFLPQVWEQIPDVEAFLENLCFKAGVFDPQAWKDKRCRLYKFTVEAFVEEKPYGRVVRKALH